MFTRAFHRLYQTTPGKYRAGQDKIILHEKANIHQLNLIHIFDYIKPQILLNKEFRVTGLEKLVKPKGNQIRELWSKFNERKSEILYAIHPEHTLGICEYMPDITDEDDFVYMACVEVTGTSIPKGMVT